MDKSEINRIAIKWIEFQYRDQDAPDDSKLIREAFRLDDLCRSNPVQALDIIVEIIRIDPSEWLLANVGAGPIEDLLTYQGDLVVDQVTKLASDNEIFKVALSMVWPHRIENSVWTKVQQAIA